MDFVPFHAPDHPALFALAPKINAEAKIAGVPPCLLAAIVARETGGQNILQYGADTKTGLLPDGSTAGVGLCQITAGVDWSDPENPTFHGYRLFDEASNLYVAAAWFIAPLAASAARAQRDNPSAFALSCRGQQAYAVAAGYNAGWGAVQKAMVRGVDADDFTTDRYATDVFAKYVEFVATSHKADPPSSDTREADFRDDHLIGKAATT